MSIFGTYDHQLRVGSTDINLKLMKNPDGTSIYTVAEEIPTYQKTIKWAQNNWIRGHGQAVVKTYYSDTGRATYEGTFPEAYFEGQSIDTTIDGKLILGPKIIEVKETDNTDLDSAPVCFTWFEATGELLCATAGKIYRYDVGGDGKWTATATVVSGVLALVEYNNVMYAARGATGVYYYSTTGIVWYPTDLIDSTAYGFFVAPNADGTDNVLWKFKQKNQLSNTTNGKDRVSGGVDWESPTYVGDSTDNITSIFNLNDQLMIGKEDGLYNLDSNGGVHSLMDDLKVNKTSNNFAYVTAWQTAIYFSLGTGAGELTGYKTFEPMGALTGIDDIGRTGITVGLSADKDWLYQAMDDGTNVTIYKGRETRYNGSLIWEWCPWVFIPVVACQTIQVAQHSATDRRLWFGYGNSTAYVQITDNPLADSSAQFAPSGWCRMSYNYGTNPYWDKMFQSIITETANCSATITVTPRYRIDTDTSPTNLTNPVITNGVVHTKLLSELSGKRIQIELWLATNNSSITPVVTYIELQGVERPEVTRIHEAVYAVGDNSIQQVRTVRDNLRAARDSSITLRFADIRYKDNLDNNYTDVVIEPGYPQEVEAVQTVGSEPELGLRVQLREVNEVEYPTLWVLD